MIAEQSADRVAPMSSNGTENQQGERLCFVVDDEPAIGRFVSTILKDAGIASEAFVDARGLTAGLERRMPDLIFLDIALAGSDAVDVLRELARRNFSGPVQVMSGSDIGLLEDVRRVGERYKLRMLPALSKPFRVASVRKMIEEQGLTAGGGRPVPAEAVAPAPAAAQPKAAMPTVDLGEALDRNWLELWYQPKIDIRRGVVSGAEGLARVRHPERGVMFPGSFIPGASTADLLRLAERAIRVALRDANDFALTGRSMKIAINVPVEALFNLPIAAIVRETRPSSPDWGGLILEVTEDQAIRDIDAAHEVATQLLIYKVALSIDDFGQGYSSLVRLKELPFAELKLDQSFVNGCTQDQTNAAICRTAIELAHRFGSLAVAEGIERPEDLATVARAGCDVAQGYLFAKAMPKELLLSKLILHGADGGFPGIFPAEPQRAAS